MNASTQLNKGTKRTAWAAALACLFTLCLAPGESRAAEKVRYFSSKAVGTTSADFLNLPLGARASAMGGAYSAISEEASGRFFPKVK